MGLRIAHGRCLGVDGTDVALGRRAALDLRRRPLTVPSQGNGTITNRISIVLGLIIVAAVVADQTLQDGVGLVFLLRKFSVFIEYIAFWR